MLMCGEGTLPIIYTDAPVEGRSDASLKLLSTVCGWMTNDAPRELRAVRQACTLRMLLSSPPRRCPCCNPCRRRSPRRCLCCNPCRLLRQSLPELLGRSVRKALCVCVCFCVCGQDGRADGAPPSALAVYPSPDQPATFGQRSTPPIPRAGLDPPARKGPKAFPALFGRRPFPPSACGGKLRPASCPHLADRSSASIVGLRCPRPSV